ncbi:MAG TPA: alpha/beta fold hydrolase [Saprospiraceae bacterium]|nr:alpha/beta fold hydrolase [Saprospiraceae bacterium]
MRNAGKNLKLTVNNLSVCYHDEGPIKAPTIVFIHGFPLNKSMWDVQLEVLKSDFRVIAYDIRGHGGSDAGIEKFSVSLFADDLLHFIDALEIENPIVCGLSMGGYIALHAIGKSPDRFAGLVLSDTQCISDTPDIRAKRMKSIENINKNGVAHYAEESIKNLFGSDSFTTRKSEISAVRDMIVQTSKQCLSHTLFALAERKGTCSKLQDIAVPVLVIVGKEDKITPPAAAHLLHEKIQGSRLEVLPKAGHLANMESPSRFNDHLRNFIKTFDKKTIPQILARDLVFSGNT